MNRDEIKGKAKDIKGHVQRQAGEWMGDSEQQLKGAGSQLEGKMQQGVGNLKDAGNKAMQDVKGGLRHERDEGDQDRARDEQQQNVRPIDKGRKAA